MLHFYTYHNELPNEIVPHISIDLAGSFDKLLHTDNHIRFHTVRSNQVIVCTPVCSKCCWVGMMIVIASYRNYRCPRQRCSLYRWLPAISTVMGDNNM